MDAVLAVLVKEGRYISFRGELSLGAIGDGKACVGRESFLERARMLELDKKVLDVAGHAESTALTNVIPFDGDAGQFISGHVELYPMVLLEKVKEEVEMFDADVFDSKVINDEAELEGSPFVAPKPRSGLCFVEAFCD